LALIGDKGFDAGWLRERLRANDMEAVIPLRRVTSGYAKHDREKYKWRHLVENFFWSIKAFRRIATRRPTNASPPSSISSPPSSGQGNVNRP
jgi:transposase